RIVHVQQIEFVKLRHLGHARCQRQIVRRIFKQRISRDLDLMIMNVRFRPGQANGLRIGDEMNLVAPASELKPQFGGDNSAAAVGWITRDANLHAPPASSPTISPLDSREGLEMQGQEYGDQREIPNGRRLRESHTSKNEGWELGLQSAQSLFHPASGGPLLPNF